MPGLTVTAGGAAGVALGGALAVRGGPVPLRGALVPHRGVLAFLHRCQGTCGNTERAVTRGQPRGKRPQGPFPAGKSGCWRETPHRNGRESPCPAIQHLPGVGPLSPCRGGHVLLQVLPEVPPPRGTVGNGPGSKGGTRMWRHLSPRGTPEMVPAPPYLKWDTEGDDTAGGTKRLQRGCTRGTPPALAPLSAVSMATQHPPSTTARPSTSGTRGWCRMTPVPGAAGIPPELGIGGSRGDRSEASPSADLSCSP